MSELNIKPLSEWGFNFNKPVVISGPCSAESEEQLKETAERLGDKGIDILRAGIWKPRTRPGTFEGLGAIALPWLKEAGDMIGKPVAVEVANREHVEECLKAEIDILWLGARTSVNPFAVQEIADAIKGVDVPVVIKNPINPDLQLWLGAIERINRAGITRIAALHRGFSSYEKGKYRNMPKWEIPIELRRLHPEIPIFCDPSHITGKRDLVPSVAQKALDLDFDGLMIESHREPEKAWSDAAQQVTPEALGELVSGLVKRHKEMDKATEDALDALRAKIDRVDHYLLELLSERMDIVAKIGEYKKTNEVTILQTTRWDEIVRDRVKVGEEKELHTDFVKSMFDAIHTESIRRQTKVMNEEG